MLKKILVTVFLGGALVFTVPAVIANPHGKDRDRHPEAIATAAATTATGTTAATTVIGTTAGARATTAATGVAIATATANDYYYYGYNRQYSGRCYYRSGYRYYYDNGYSSRYCDEYYARHGYRPGSYPSGYDTCDEYDYRAGTAATATDPDL